MFRKPVPWPDLIAWLEDVGSASTAQSVTNNPQDDRASTVAMNTAIIEQMLTSLPPDTVKRLFGRFQEDMAKRLNELEQAIAQKDVEQIRKTTHAICGIASAFGATGLERHARQLHNQPEQIFAMLESDALDTLKTLSSASESKLAALIN